jgi:TRAP-type C4-dicarboxylate transport system permease small subunit
MVHAVSRGLSWVAAGASIIMMLLIVINVVGRFILRKPLPGTIEIVEMLTAALIFSSLAYTEHLRRHIHVDLLVSRLPRRAQAVLASVMYFFSGVFFIVMAWQGGILIYDSVTPLVQASHVLSIPEAPFLFVVALGSLLLGIELLIHVFQPLPPEKDEKEVT